MRFTVSEMQAAERLTMNSNPSLETNVTYSGSSFGIFGVRWELIVVWAMNLSINLIENFEARNARSRADVPLIQSQLSSTTFFSVYENSNCYGLNILHTL